MRRRARTDDNQKSIVEALRLVGATVAPTHMIGKGFPDIVVGFRGRNYLFEIKDGNKSASRRALTPDEQEFIDAWRGTIHVVKDEREAIDIIYERA